MQDDKYIQYNHALWAAINFIAKQNGRSCSGLALLCGMDATTFNISKRKSKYGQPRWITGDTLVKILTATQTSPIQFAKIYQRCLDNPSQGF